MGPVGWPGFVPGQGSDSKCLIQKNPLSAKAEGQQPQMMAPRFEDHREKPPLSPGVLCGARLGSRGVGKGRQRVRWAWADSSSLCALGTEVQRGWQRCQKPVEALRAIHGKGQETEEQGEAGQAQGGCQGKEGPVLDLAVPKQEQQQKQQGQQKTADFQPGGAGL